MNTTGTIFDIQRFSLHDGPGIRTTVFFKGCPLHCLWCHNPESQDFLPEISYNPTTCITCGACVAVCPLGCHTMDDARHGFDRTHCTRCGRCADACCTGALVQIGRLATVEEVLADVLRDKPFYDTSGGGLTLSGGEPLAQPAFAAALLAAAKANGLHTAVETSGSIPFAVFAAVLATVDLFLYDIKETDSDAHLRFTGGNLDAILANLHQLDHAGAAIRLRCPIIPGLNDRDTHFEELARIAGSLQNVQGIDLIPYHPLGTGKTEHLGKTNSYQAKMPTDDTVAHWHLLLHAAAGRNPYLSNSSQEQPSAR